MTEEKRTESGESRRWAREAQEALDRTAEALRTAWEATRESRMGALEAAKRAARELGEAVERGVEVARDQWKAEEEQGEEATGTVGSESAETGVDPGGDDGVGRTEHGGPPSTPPPPPGS